MSNGVISGFSSELIQELVAHIINWCNDLIELSFITLGLEIFALFHEFSKPFVEEVVALGAELLRLLHQDLDDFLNEIVSCVGSILNFFQQFSLDICMNG